MSLNDMNRSGVVIGSFKTQALLVKRAFRWDQRNGFVMLAAPPGVYEWVPERINDFGMIAGHGKVSGIPNTYEQIIVWSPEGVPTLVPPPTPIHGFEVNAITNTGVVGGYTNAGVPNLIPFQLQDGAMLPLPRTFARLHASIEDLTSDGQFGGRWWDAGFTVTGAYLANMRSITFVDAPPGYFHPQFNALNRIGHAQMTAKTAADVLHTFFWVDDVATDLGIWPGMTWCSGADMNDLDQIIGACAWSNASGSGSMRFLWQSGTMYDLSTLIVLPPGISLLGGIRILDDGRILGLATAFGNQTKICILTPDTEPEDITVDCVVDMRDLKYVLDQWGPVTEYSVRRADVDGDGVVGAFDLGAVLGAWTAR